MKEDLDIFSRLKKLMADMETSEVADLPENKLDKITIELKKLINEFDSEKQVNKTGSDILKHIVNQEGLLWVKDLEGRYIAVTKFYANLYGIDHTEFFIGKTDAELYSVDNANTDILRSHDNQLLETQTPFSINEKLVLPQHIINDQAYKAAYYDVNGHHAGTVGYLRDVSKINQLELQNRKLTKAIEQSTATIVITDIKGIIEYVNPQFTKSTGYTYDEAIGMNPKILKSDVSSPESYKVLWETISSGKEWRGEFCNRKKNGENYWESAVISPVFDKDGSIINYIAVKDDITKIKQNETELIRMSNLQDLLTSISIENININQEQIQENIIESLAKIACFVEADRALIFKYDWEHEKCFPEYEWHNDDFDDLLPGFTEILFSEITPWIENHKQNHIFHIPYLAEYDGNDGNELRAKGVKAMISVPFFVNNNCLGFISFDNVKKQHLYTQKEMSLLEVFGQIYANLLQRSDLEKNLKLEIENVKKANQAKSEFLANMSHELRTPLNGVIGFSELLLNTEVNKVQLQYTNAINTSAKSLLNIINEILDFSKIEAGKLELEIEKNDVIQMIENCIDIVKYSAEKKGIALLLNISDHLPRFAYIDSFRVSQIIINLLNNAVKFTNQGEVELKVEFLPNIDDTGVYTFSIRDTGIGISDENKIKLFRAFGQADTSTTRKFGGTGLGLIISEKLAQKMNSHIVFESEPKKGSVFSFSLNLLYESQSAVFTEKIENLKKVLIIDDNFTSRVLIEKMFINWGIETVICDSPAEAVFILQMGTTFDVIVVDNNMTEGNAIKSIKSICKQLNIEVHQLNFLVLHSASVDISFLNECRSLGIKHLFEKPIRYDVIFNYLKNINKSIPEVINDWNESPTPSSVLDVKNILVADDDIFNMMLTKAMISNILPNVKVTEAVNGRIAYEEIVSNQYDLVFMDVQMPLLDGNEATKKIREFEKNTSHHTIIVGLTAGALKEEREKCFQSGMDEFLTKPIDSQKLRDAIDRFLGSKS